jgi:hypothetical protein
VFPINSSSLHFHFTLGACYHPPEQRYNREHQIVRAAGPAELRGKRYQRPRRTAPRDLVLLPNSGFVLPPKLYFSAGGERLADRFDCVWETFLKSSTASSFWA